MFYDFNKLLSYNALLNFVIGERGVGKSYGAKKYCVNHWKKKRKQFVYLRRYKTELKKALGTNKEPKFFNQIKKEFPEDKLSNSAESFYCNGEVIGYAMPLSTANILKSSSYEDVDTIIFDEFTIDKGTYHYLQNEVIQFLDVIETVARLRDIRVILLGNAISITNPYFAFFNLSLPYNSEFKLFKDGLIVVNYIKNMEYRKAKKETRFGKLIEGTSYGKYAIDNEMLRDSKAFVRKKSNNVKFYFIFIVNGVYYGVWIDYKEKLMFVSHDYDPNCPFIFSLNTNDHTEQTLFIKVKNNPFFKTMISYYRLAKLNFESQQIKNEVMEEISKFLTY